MGARVGARESSASGDRVCGFERAEHRAGKLEPARIARLEPVAPPVGDERPAETIEIIIIEERTLIRECLGQSLKAMLRHPVSTFATVDAWQAAQARHTAGVIILGVRGNIAAAPVQAAIGKLSNAAPLVLMADTEQPEEIVAALGNGARGCIPTGTCLEVAAHAVRLVMAGGTFVPANSLIAASRSSSEVRHGRRVRDDMFTPRQQSIIEELCRGKANKVIAHDLNMCESTVKVHVRNIMKKLKATSRTEVAYFIANGLHAQRDAEGQAKRSGK